MKTLILVDVQNDFMPGGALEVREGDKIIRVINKMISKFDLVVATQDWHPSNHKSFAINHAGHEEFETIEWHGIEQKLWPPHCIQNTPGADFHRQLATECIEAIFRKGMDENIDSYSGFFDNGHKKSTGLAGYLKDKGAKDLYFCGLAGDVCVYFTILDALKEGFKATLIKDAAIPLQKENFEAIQQQILDKGGRIKNSEEI